MKIGMFQKDISGSLSGNIHALGIGVVPVAMEPIKAKDGKAYLKVIAYPYDEAYEIGAAFEKQKDGMTYYSVTLESPAFKAPLNAGLFPDKSREDAFRLVWDRPEQPKPNLQANADTEVQLRRPMGAAVTP